MIPRRFTRSILRAAEIGKRKEATKARLRAPILPPTEPVALPWKRTSPRGGRLARRAVDQVWSTIMSGDAADLEGALAAAASMVLAITPALRARGGRR